AGAGRGRGAVGGPGARPPLGRGGGASDSALALRVAGRGVRALPFACDAPLRPYKVALPPDGPAALERWDFEPARKPGGPSTLTLHFRQPVSGTLHPQVFCRAELRQPRP